MEQNKNEKPYKDKRRKSKIEAKKHRKKIDKNNLFGLNKKDLELQKKYDAIRDKLPVQKISVPDIKREKVKKKWNKKLATKTETK